MLRTYSGQRMRLLDFLKSQLRAHSWTMTDLARASGMSKQAVSQWMAEEESLRLTPSPQSCRKLAEALGADPDYVLELAGHRQAATQPRAEVDPDLAVVAATWATLDDGIRRAIRILAASQPPVTSARQPRVTTRERHRNGANPGRDGPLAPASYALAHAA